MRKFTALDITSAGIAEGRTFEYVSLGAVTSSIAVAAVPKLFADQRTRRRDGMGEWAIRFGTVPFSIVKTVRHTFWRHFMGEVAIFPVWTVAILQKFFANGDFVRVVLVSTRRALWTRTCNLWSVEFNTYRAGLLM